MQAPISMGPITKVKLTSRPSYWTGPYPCRLIMSVASGKCKKLDQMQVFLMEWTYDRCQESGK